MQRVLRDDTRRPSSRPRREYAPAVDRQRFEAVRLGLLATQRLSEDTHSADLAAGERHAVEQTVRTGVEARNHLILKHAGLVSHLARRFHPTPEERQDVLQEGTIGLLRAIERFDPDRGFAFSTYAAPWIVQAMSKWASRHRSQLSVPPDGYFLLRAAARTAEQQEDPQAKPSTEDVATAVGCTATRLQHLMAAARPTLSLDVSTTISGAPRQAAIPPTVSDVETNALSSFSWVADVLALLDSREVMIVTALLGLDGGKPMSYRELSGQLGVTAERVRQLYGRARAKLSHPSVARRVTEALRPP